jgi:hypothetical protein
MYRYFLATWTYGLIRSAPHFYDREKKYFNNKLVVQETRQMLWNDKLGNVLYHAAIAPFVWPGYLANDVTLLELLLRRKDPEEHGFDQNWETVGLVCNW